LRTKLTLDDFLKPWDKSEFILNRVFSR